VPGSVDLNPGRHRQPRHELSLRWDEPVIVAARGSSLGQLLCRARHTDLSFSLIGISGVR